MIKQTRSSYRKITQITYTMKQPLKNFLDALKAQPVFLIQTEILLKKTACYFRFGFTNSKHAEKGNSCLRILPECIKSNMLQHYKG